MKRVTILAALLALALPALAAQHGGGHGGMSMPANAHAGAVIRTTEMEGMKLRYEVIDMAEMMKGKTPPGHDMAQMKSHHLMTILSGADGKPVPGAKLGYLVTGPDKKEQKAMTMFMEGGYGADVDFKAKGSYKILMKADVNGKTVKDEFTYEVK